MLSVLIPVYNYNVVPLVKKLHQQALLLNIPFEIIICDDASTETFNNAQLADLSQIKLLFNKQNINIAKTRNRLLAAASFKWVIFIDADVIPTTNNFLIKYWKLRSKGVFFSGGFSYPKVDNNCNSLRLLYGEQIEQHTHLRSCCNIFFNREIVTTLFDETIANYGFEDTLFYLEVELKNKITYVNNKVYHYSTDTNSDFLAKTKKACQTLVQLIKDNKLQVDDVQLSKTYNKIASFRLLFILSFLEFFFFKRLQKNLIGNNPKLFYFQWFKLFAYHQAQQQLSTKKSIFS